MDPFESLLAQHRDGVDRFVKFRIPSLSDAEDVLQEVYLTAFLKFGQLKNNEAFKPWLLAIARSRCNDYFRLKYKSLEISMEDLPDSALIYSRHGITLQSAVADAMAELDTKDQDILCLYFWQELPQAEIARRLNIPLGTVKSRLHIAKKRFKERYPYPPKPKGEEKMGKLPEWMPAYTIEQQDLPPFDVRWEELQGWMIVPRLGEKLSWGLYETPSGRRTEHTDIEVIGKAEVHGIEGVEIVAVQYGAEDYYRTGSVDKMERRFVAQLTDTHSRYLAESHTENGVRKCYTFLDGGSFLDNWGFGENNCGNEVNLTAKGLLQRTGNIVTGETCRDIVDVVGRYRVAMGGKTYDTICVMDVQAFNDQVVTEQFLDRNGRTILWRRYNRDDWALEHFGGRPWSEKLPNNDRLIVNGQTFVHWYDCISDYIF